ncbi:MAG: LolA-related protein [Acidiferrobacterales bacterium]
MRLLILIYFLLVALTTPAWALAATNDFTLNSLMKLLASKQESSGTFVELRYNSLLKNPVRITGKLYYKKPDLLIKENLAPVAETLKIKGDSITYEKLENGKKISRTLAVEDFPFLKTMVVGLRATFAGNLDSLKNNYNVTLTGNRADWRLDLITNVVETDPDKLFDNIVTKLVISGSGTDFRKIEMFDQENDRTVINISPL